MAEPMARLLRRSTAWNHAAFEVLEALGGCFGVPFFAAFVFMSFAGEFESDPGGNH
jgi:hypothetical protein